MVAGACRGKSSSSTQRHQHQQHAKQQHMQWQQHCKAAARASATAPAKQQRAKTSTAAVCKAAADAVLTVRARVAACKGSSSSMQRQQQQQYAKAAAHTMATAHAKAEACHVPWAAVLKVGPASSVPLTLALVVSKACQPQLAPVCISLFKCISACPGTHQFAPMMKAGRQAATRTGPAMSLIVILGFAEVEQMSVALDAAMTVTRQVGRQAAAAPGQHKLVSIWPSDDDASSSDGSLSHFA